MAIDAKVTGILLHSKTASFEDEDKNIQTYGKVQLVVPDQSNEFSGIQNIKCKKENFGMLVDLAKLKGKEVTLTLDSNDYKGKTSYYLSERNKFAA